MCLTNRNAPFVGCWSRELSLIGRSHSSCLPGTVARGLRALGLLLCGCVAGAVLSRFRTQTLGLFANVRMRAHPNDRPQDFVTGRRSWNHVAWSELGSECLVYIWWVASWVVDVFFTHALSAVLGTHTVFDTTSSLRSKSD